MTDHALRNSVLIMRRRTPFPAEHRRLGGVSLGMLAAFPSRLRLTGASAAWRWLVVGLVTLALLPAADPASSEFFEQRVRPVLAEHCYQCHATNAKKIKADLVVDSLAGLLHGGEAGPAIVVGQPEQSLLVKAIAYADPNLQMPPKTRLAPAQVADISAWIKAGAPWPADPAGSGTPAARTRAVFDLAQRKKEHWAWQPIVTPALPAVRQASWPHGPIDRFVLAGLEQAGLQPAPAADRRTLFRRVTLDLTGLPPTAAEVDAFVADPEPTALAKRVDALLASPRFGERWGRHWLDLVRYADSRGHEFDYPIPNAWQYRDYVIRALNADVPYDQFVREHLAGDLLPKPRRNPQTGANESVLGTGFWFLGEGVHSPVDIRQDEADRFDNMIDVTAKAFLGLTVSCARCHDHKFDAISTKDYYAFAGFLQSSHYGQVRFETMDQEKEISAELWRLRRAQAPVIAKQVGQTLAPAVTQLADYLLAAREALGPQPAKIPAERCVPATNPALAPLAAAKNLDPAILGRWMGHLSKAVSDPADPFSPWAMGSGAAGGLQALAKAESAAPDAVVIDYGRPGEPWLPDGVAFGPGPVPAGTFLPDAAHPVTELTAATFDPFWRALKRARDATLDPVGLAYERSGITLRTRTFTLTSGRLWILMRGSARLYAGVDSHALVYGPLHAKLCRTLEDKAGTGRFTWRAVDLSDYREHRAHLEFTPTGTDFALAQVVQSEKPPTGSRALSSLARQLLPAAGSPETLAAAYQRLASQAVAHVSRGGQAEPAVSEDVALLAAWLIEHPALTGLPEREALSAAYRQERDRLAAKLTKASHLAPAMFEGTGEDDYVMVRGSWKNRGEPAPRQLLTAIAGTQAPITQGSGRLELAERILAPSNPFAARVLVNRLWHHLFGRGVVASVDNFGVLGDKPTHPELLDQLAGDFVRQGWSIKRAIREMVLSATYQMVSHADPVADAKDPGNRLLHRMNVRRLESEIIRDQILAVSGRLDPTMGGPGVPTNLTDFMQGRGRPKSGPLDGAGRRTIYLTTWRNFLSPMLMAFDTPTPFNTIGRRTVSNVPAQALILLNDPFVIGEAGRWAQQVLAVPGHSPAERVALMFRAAFARPPSASETAAVLAFLDQEGGRTSEKAWADLAHTLMNSKEFIYCN